MLLLHAVCPPCSLDEPEFDPMRDHFLVWMLIAAQDLVAMTNHPNPEIFAGRIAVCAAAADDRGGTGEGVSRVRARIASALDAWMGPASAVP